MTIAIRQLHPLFAGEVEGVDLRRPLGADEVRAIVEGMDKLRRAGLSRPAR